ncbi:MAG: CYTH domain-containing protein [Bacteroidales bacterium]|nr:CYTH domain-containing protein [Bacteroidales bacterium]
MHIETERKFLVRDSSYRAQAVESHRVRQGYIAHDSGRTVRVRIWDERGILTIKGPTFGGMSRLEWEEESPLQDAEDLFLFCKPGVIDKVRYIIPAGERRFEVDEFHGDNEGLVMAEIELGSPGEAFERPAWLGEEVTGDKRYYNSYLSRCPFRTWA